MSEDFGTVNVKQADRAREIDVIRQHYRQHRDTLQQLAGEAPTDHLATEYTRLIREIDMALGKLDELEGRRGPAVPAAEIDTMRMKTGPGDRPLAQTPAAVYGESEALPPAASSQTTRTLLILLVGVIVLGVIGYMIWRASSPRDHRATVVEQPGTSSTSTSATTTSVTETPVTPAPAPAAPLKIAPASADYGQIRKGTRAVRQFEITNTTSAPIAIDVARSTCRCLYYDYAPTVPAKGKGTITVTVDGARAKEGTLSETLHVTAKKDPTATVQFNVTAVIK